LAIVAAVCPAKAFSCFIATVAAFEHRGNNDFQKLTYSFLIIAIVTPSNRPGKKHLAAKPLDARRIRANVAKLPELLGNP
jgi:hypothetical protein